MKGVSANQNIKTWAASFALVDCSSSDGAREEIGDCLMSPGDRNLNGRPDIVWIILEDKVGEAGNVFVIGCNKQ